MNSSPTGKAAIFVDRSCTDHWIVRDPEGKFWIVPSAENAWDCRRPFDLTDNARLEPIPGHYKYVLGLPF